MASDQANDTQPAAPKERVRWTETETFTLIRIWEEHIGDLRRAKRNAKVYAAIVEKLRAAGIDRTVKEVKSKIENLANKYRDINKNKRTGSGCIRWPFYWAIQKFLGTLPINDASLVQESGCNNETVEQIIYQMEVGNVPLEEPVEPDFELAPSQNRDLAEDTPPPAEMAPPATAPPVTATAETASAATGRPPTPQRTQAASKKKPPSGCIVVLKEILDEQWKMREALERSREREYDLRRRQLLLQEESGKREQELVSVLKDLTKKL
ncbi:hypothetical protein HPB50_029087 [Hyalomma asiaticum]|nr:hypothetical protein HPB50_029087 [Hyalomma asiaticum]